MKNQKKWNRNKLNNPEKPKIVYEKVQLGVNKPTERKY